MVIDKKGSYSIIEASKVTGVQTRTLTRLAVTLKVDKIDNRYILQGSQLIDYLKSRGDNVEELDDLLLKIDELNTEKYNLETTVNRLSNKVKTLSNDKTELEKKVVEFETIIKEKESHIFNKLNEIHELKKSNKKTTHEVITSNIPHKDKLRQAIQLITLEALEQGVMHKVFTDEEYNDIIGTISEVDFQKEQVQYLRTRVEKQDVILQELVQQTTQRNFITAKEKGFDKD